MIKVLSAADVGRGINRPVEKLAPLRNILWIGNILLIFLVLWALLDIHYIRSDALFDLTGRLKIEENPYFYFRNGKKNIEVWIMKLSDLIENVKRKLNYMSAILEVKDIDVQDKASRDFEEIDFGRISPTLKKVSV